MPLIVMDGFDDRAILNDGTTVQGETWTGFNLYDYVHLGYPWAPSSKKGIRSTLGRFGGSAAAQDDIDMAGYGGWPSDQMHIEKNVSTNQISFGIAISGMLSQHMLAFYTASGLTCVIQSYFNQFVLTYPGVTPYLVSTKANRTSVWGYNYISGKIGIGLGSGNDYFSLYVNGEEIFNRTGLTLGGDAITKIAIPELVNCFDDIYVFTNDSTHRGDCRVVSLKPNGAGASSNFTPQGDSPNYLCVDETEQDFDSTYNGSSTSGHRDSFQMENLSSKVSAGTVYGVQARILCKRETGDTFQIKPYVLVSGTRYYGSNFTPPDDVYTYCHYIWEVNPATSNPWTVSELDNVEVGYEVV